MIISGKEITKKIKEQLKVEVEEIKNKYNRLPKLAVILVGENQASQVYVKNKERGCSSIIFSSLILFDKLSRYQAHHNRKYYPDTLYGLLHSALPPPPAWQ